MTEVEKKGCCSCCCDAKSEQYCCNCSTREHRVMNFRFILDVICIAVTFLSGIGVFLLLGIFGTAGALAIWLMFGYTIFAAFILCNCCNCSHSAKYVPCDSLPYTWTIIKTPIINLPPLTYLISSPLIGNVAAGSIYFCASL